MMLFVILTFCLFWFTYRYQMIYVSFAQAETNGLIFPKAINQLFTGLYFMELCLIGLFLLVRDEKDRVACFPQAIIMVVALIGTVGFQILVNNAFRPFFKYLPITFEDDAVRRDEEFERAQASRWAPKDQEKEDEGRSLSSELEERERQEEEENTRLEEEDRRRSKQHRNSDNIELQSMDKKARSSYLDVPNADAPPGTVSSSRQNRKSWADRSQSRSRSRPTSLNNPRKPAKSHSNPLGALTHKIREGIDTTIDTTTRPIRDIEAQTNPEAYLFTDMQDALEDIEPEARQKLIKRAFEHPASRAIQPAIWVPHDEIGVTADEIRRTGEYSRNIWITSKNARLDAKAHVMFRGLPPDWDPFENMEI
jgi:hypothetical protein